MKKQLTLPLLLLLATFAFAGNGNENVAANETSNLIQSATTEQLPSNFVDRERILFSKTSALEQAVAERFALKNKAKAIPAIAVAPRGFSYEETVETGYMGILEIGGSFGVGGKLSNFPTSVTPFSRYNDVLQHTFNQNFFSLQVINGRLINRKVFVGFGLGFDVSPTPTIGQIPVNLLMPFAQAAGSNDFLVPVFVDIRGYILKRRISPYIEGKLGYAWYFSDPLVNGYTYTGGGTIGLSVGARAYVHKLIAVDLSLGYRFQNLITQLPVSNYTGNYNETAVTFLNFINLMVGISF